MPFQSTEVLTTSDTDSLLYRAILAITAYADKSLMANHAQGQRRHRPRLGTSKIAGRRREKRQGDMMQHAAPTARKAMRVLHGREQRHPRQVPMHHERYVHQLRDGQLRE
eukprot:3031839-Pyramimonas_sp.AAC.2